MGKKILITLGIIILVVLIAAGGLYLYIRPYTQNVMQKVELTIDSISVERSLQTPELATVYIELSATNYLPWTIGFDSLVLRGTHSDTLYIAGLDNRGATVKEGERITFKVPLLVQYQRLQTLKKLADSLGGKMLDVDFSIYLDLPVIGKFSHTVNEKVDLEGGESPTFSITNIAVNVGKDFERADVNIFTQIGGNIEHNVVLDSLSYSLKIEGKTYIWGNKRDTVFPKHDLVLPATLALKNLRDKLKSKANEDKTPVTIEGNIQVTYKDLFNKTPVYVNFETMARLPIPPDITIEKVKLDDVSWTDARLVVVLKAVNENPFGLTFNRLNYKLHLNGDKWTETTITDGFRVGPHDTQLIELPAEVGWLDLGEAAFNFIRGRTEVDYTFEAQLDLVFDIDVLNKVKLRIHHSGKADIEEMRKQQKDARKEERKDKREAKREAKNK